MKNVGIMIAIQHEDVDIGRLINDAKQEGTGAVVVFDGIVRDDDIREMESRPTRRSHLPGLEKIAEDAKGSMIFSISISFIGLAAFRLGRIS